MVLLRPESILLRKDGQYKGKVMRKVYLGANYRYVLQYDDAKLTTFSKVELSEGVEASFSLREVTIIVPPRPGK